MQKEKKSYFSYAMSLAASWAWGVSIVVGIENVQTKGIVPFIIWAIANSLALPLFGLIAFRIQKLEAVVSSKIICLFMTIVMVFCLWIQMNAIYQYLCKVDFMTDVVAKIITIIISLGMAVLLFKDGLIKSIKIDNPLWFACYGILVVLIILGIVMKNDTYEIVAVKQKGDIAWALNSCLILFSGPIMNIQNWQMADKLKKENLMKSHYLAGVLFAIYMCLVAVLASFHFTGIMNLLLVAVILCIALSTMDAAIVGMQKIAGRNVGLGLSLVSIALWIFVIPMGVMNLWTTMGNIRKYVAAISIMIAIVWRCIEKKNKKR